MSPRNVSGLHQGSITLRSKNKSLKGIRMSNNVYFGSGKKIDQSFEHYRDPMNDAPRGKPLGAAPYFR